MRYGVGEEGEGWDTGRGRRVRELERERDKRRDGGRGGRRGGGRAREGTMGRGKRAKRGSEEGRDG